MAREKVSILIVDDTPVNLRLLVSVLARQNYMVRAARSGAMALESVRSAPPDLILLDINMPEMNGYQVCEHLKADPATQGIPVIFISALNDTEDIVKAFDMGGVDYITKPFKVREVIARVESQLTLAAQRYEIEQLLERDRQQFARVDQMHQQFIGSMTHDLKNPLAMIKGYVHLLEKKTEGDPAAAEYLSMIGRGVEKMKLLVTDILDLIQVDVKPQEHADPLSVANSLQACYEEFISRAQARHLTFLLEMPSPDVLVEVEATRLARCLDNLVDNAIKYTSKGTVTLRAVAHEEEVIIEVEDTGLGIPADEIPRIFEAFFRVTLDTHRVEEGTGLGLFIVKTIVEQESGHIEVESELGKCSLLRVTLPIAQAAPTPLDTQDMDALV